MLDSALEAAVVRAIQRNRTPVSILIMLDSALEAVWLGDPSDDETKFQS